MKKTFVYDTETGRIFGPDLTIQDIVNMLKVNGIKTGVCEIPNIYGQEEPVFFNFLSKEKDTINVYYGINSDLNIPCIQLVNLLEENRVQFLVDELGDISLIFHDHYDLMEMKKALEFIIETIDYYPLEEGDIPEPLPPIELPPFEDDEEEEDDPSQGGTELEEDDDDDFDFTW